MIAKNALFLVAAAVMMSVAVSACGKRPDKLKHPAGKEQPVQRTYPSAK